MQSNVQLTCACDNYAKYKKFYDEAIAYEWSLYWAFAEFLLVCSATGIVLFFLFAGYIRICKTNGTLPIEDNGSSSVKMRCSRALTKEPSSLSSPVPFSQRDSISSISSSDYTSSTSSSSLDSRRSSADSSSSSETLSHCRPPFVPNRRSFVKIIGTIKDFPQKVQDEVRIPSFGRRQSANKMKRSQSTSQVPLASAPLYTPVLPSTMKDDSSIFTHPFVDNYNVNHPTRILESNSPITPSPAPACNPSLYSAPAALEFTPPCPVAPSTPRRPTLKFAKSLQSIPTSMGPRSPSTRSKFPPLPRRQSAKSCLGIHLEEQEGETEL